LRSGFGRIGAVGTGNFPIIAARHIPTDFVGDAVAVFAFGLELLEVVDFAEGAEEVLAEIGVDAGFLGSDASADAIEENGFEEAMDFIGGGEGAGGFG
jgi:hypothetical protein